MTVFSVSVSVFLSRISLKQHGLLRAPTWARGPQPLINSLYRATGFCMNESCHCISYSRCTWVFEHPTVKGFFKSLISATYKNRQRGTVRRPGGKKSRRKSNRCLMMNVVEYSAWIQSAESKVPTNIHHRYVAVLVYVCVIQLICTRVWRRTKRDFIKCKVWLHGDVVHKAFTGTLCACYQILIPIVPLDF